MTAVLSLEKLHPCLFHELAPRYGTGVETTPAILLRKIKLTDTSLIVTWFTQAHGKIKTVAKGARRPKSPFAGKLDLFFHEEIQFHRSRTSELHILKEVALRETFEGLRQNYERMLPA